MRLILLWVLGTLSFHSFSADIEAKIKAAGIELTTKDEPSANFVYAVQSGNLLFLSGHVPISKEGKIIAGKLADDLSVEQEKARQKSLR